MSGLRALAEADLKHMIEDVKTLGTPYILIDKNGGEHPLVGTFGDIGSLVDPVSGEVIQGRTIEATCNARTITAASGAIPRRGWKARIAGLDEKEIVLFVQRNEYDRTIGLCRLALGLEPKETEHGE